LLKERIIKLVLIISLFVALFVAIILAILIIIDYSFLVGWLVGCVVSILGYLLNIFTSKWLFSKKRTKRGGFVIGSLRIQLQMIYYGLFIVFIIFFDIYVNTNSLNLHNHLKDVLSPINIISFIAGLSLIMFSAIISHLPIFKVREHGQDKSAH
jgi:hypothetical protein